MVYSARYKSFSKDKQSFFSDVHTADDAKGRANEKDYRFLADNRLLIEQEFNQLFACLKKQGTDRQDFWLYCYYCCIMLQNYYAAYDKKNKAQEYRQESEKLLHRCEHGSFPAEEVDSLQKKIATDLGVLASTPKHIAKIRDWLAFTNIHRIHFNFCRFTVKQTVLLANELKWLEKLDQFLGTKSNIDGMVSTLNAPGPVFNLLSVGLFAARFIINAGLLLRHTFLPSEEERALSMSARFYQELYARHCTMLNDVVWGTVNLLTNYASIFNISGPVANWVTAGFLVFDVSLLIYRRHLAEKEYLFKKAEYLNEKRNYETLMNAASISIEEMKIYQARCKMLDEQLSELELSWQTSSATFLFNVAAAALLMGGFTAALLLATPAAVTVCYFVCTIAVAMYLTADIYGKLHEKSRILQQKELENKDTAIARAEMIAARNDFILAMAKNIIIPLLIVTVFAVCWQAALILAAVYVGYECMHGYFKQLSPPNNNTATLRASESHQDENRDAEVDSHSAAPICCS